MIAKILIVEGEIGLRNRRSTRAVLRLKVC